MKRPAQLGDGGPHRLANAVACGITDTGPVRPRNEDNFLIDAELELLAVADGMGGHQSGAAASAGALDALREFVRLAAYHPLSASKPPDAHGTPDPDATWADPTMLAVRVLYDAVDFANGKLYAQNQQRQMHEGSGMGTTLTGVWRPQPGGPLMLFHVGDSRLYRYRQQQLVLLTRDQTWYQQALESGNIDNLPARNLLLQAIGPNHQVKPEVRAQLVQPGDLLMLCSDGLHGCVPHQDMADLLAGATADTLPDICRQMVVLAKQYRGRDNVTVLLVMCHG